MTTIITKNGSGAPTAGQLSEGELAVDLTNKELYTKSGSTVIKIGGTGGGETGTFTDLTATSSFTSPGIDDNANATAITIDASENVGIGATSPTNKLSIGSGGKMQAYNVGNTRSILVYNDSNAATVEADVDPLKLLSADSVRFNTGGNNERMRITNTGNVGIGQDVPSAPLTVDGPSNDTYVARFGNFAGGGGSIQGRTDIGLDFWATENGTYPAAAVGVEQVSTDQYRGGLLFSTRGTNSDVAPVERMRIDASGQVGIGTDNPSASLHVAETASGLTARFSNESNQTLDIGTVAGSGAAGSVYLDNANSGNMQFRIGGSERMRITSSGDIIAKSGHIQIDGTTNTGPAGERWIGGNGTTTDLYLNAATGGQMILGVGNSNAAIIDSTGNVGIGTSAPVDKFDVKASGDDERLVRISHPSSPTAAAGYFGFTDTGLGANTGVALGVQYAGGYYDALTIDRETRNVGIGTTNPTAKMVVEVGNNEPASSGNMDTGMVVQSGNGSRAINMGGSNTGGYNWINSAYANNSSVAANLVLMTGAQERMRIDSSGNAVIGGNGNAYSSGSTTITPTGDISNSSASGVASTLNLAGIGGVSNGFQITTNTSNKHEYTFLNGPTVAMKLDTSGNLLVGTTASVGAFPARLEILGGSGGDRCVNIKTDITGYVNHITFHNGNGQVGSIYTDGSTTGYNTSSDVRLKKNIVDAPAGNIDSIKVRSFDWKVDGEHQEYGFIAQELETVAPYAVSKGETDEDMWAVDYSKLVPMMIKEIQDLKAEVAALKGA